MPLAAWPPQEPTIGDVNIYPVPHPTCIMNREKLTHDAYTVGWVCVLECELNASRALLDEEHERLPAADRDDNMYLLGEIRGHNVVIAFPAVYGIGAAAQTATNMIRTFRNIRFGLMVGIGGAAPNPAHFDRPLEDIRLGDVVVSEPKGDQGGVIHYDMGQWKGDGKFQKRSHLNKPPTILLNAVKLLRSDHPFGRGEMNRYIAEVASLCETLDALGAYRFPGRDKDRLFRMDFAHDGEEDCSRCDITKAETRTPRKTDAPSVHYGLIASGNAVVKDPHRRDDLRKAWGVACFEMEAAGLMDNFPCLVIRGISDYADTHKNDLWQPYAAVAAAAYAKDILRVILPEDVRAVKAVDLTEVLDVLSSIRSDVAVINSAITATQETELLTWLSPKDYGSEQADSLSQREEGTGTWLLESQVFQTWVENENETIYCRGMPGAGKTVMTAVVVDYFRTRFEKDSTVGIACLYCSVQNEAEQTLSHLFSSLLRQLLRQLSYTPELVKSMYDRHKRAGDRPTFREVVNALQSTISCFKRVFILVDALDELLTSESPPKQLVREIFALQAKAPLNLFATSRLVPEIEGEFNKSIVVDVRASEADVVRFLDSNIGELPAFVSATPGLEDEIKTGIIDAIDGMFLLAKLYLNSLRDKISIRDVKDTLKTLPRGFDGYDQSYLLAMDNIQGQRTGLRELAMRVLSWICCSRRLLFITELQHALSVKRSHTELDELNVTEVGLILSVCKGLVTVDGERGTIRLVHYTTQQYFERTWTSWFPEAHEKIAETTLRYLTFDTFHNGACTTGGEFKARLDQYSLYDYAAQNWGHHVQKASLEEDTLVMTLLESVNQLASAAQAMFAARSQPRSERSPRGMTGLHVAAYFGLEKTARLLCEKGRLDAKDSWGRTPVSWASVYGHAAVVEALLERDSVDPDCEDDEGQTPLYLASDNGHAKVVELLLRHGADPHSRDREGETPLSIAAGKGHEAVMRVFIDSNVDVGHENSSGETPLMLAAGRGHTAIVEHLLKSSAPMVRGQANSDGGKVDGHKDNTDTGAPFESTNGGIALSRAAANGHVEIVKLLLEYGAHPDGMNGDRETPLFSASKYGHEAVVDLLLAHPKVNPNPQNAEWDTALSIAALNGHENAVRLLLSDSRVNPDHRDKDGGTPLSRASYWGHEAVVNLLLSTNRVDVNSMDSSGQTPLARAAENGGEAIVKRLLLHPEVEPDHRQPATGNTPLAVAAAFGRDLVVELLLTDERVSPNPVNNKGATPLSVAAREGRADVVEILLRDDRVDPNHLSGNGRTPLSWACGRGHRVAVDHLLALDRVDANVADDEGRTPLLWAAWNGYPAIVSRLLSSRTVDLECRDSNGQTPLNRAAEGGGLAAVELLLSGGADPNAEDKDRMTPLTRAVENGHVEVAEALLNAGASTSIMDCEGRTPLLIAVEAGRIGAVEVLLNDAGLDPNASGEYGYTPLELAEECGWDEIVDLLEQARQRRPPLTGQNIPPRASFSASPWTSAIGLSNPKPAWGWEQALRTLVPPPCKQQKASTDTVAEFP